MLGGAPIYTKLSSTVYDMIYYQLYQYAPFILSYIIYSVGDAVGEIGGYAGSTVHVPSDTLRT